MRYILLRQKADYPNQAGSARQWPRLLIYGNVSGMTPRSLFLFLSLGLSSAAIADDGSFCPERPGQTTPPCVLASGQVALEMSAVAWTLNKDSASRADTYIFGDSMVRIGVGDNLEAQIGWTPIGYTRARDIGSHALEASTQSGDLTIGALYALGGPSGPVAVQGFVFVPTGASPIGAGDWGAGLRLPIAIAVEDVQFGLTPEVDAAVNASGAGRHLALGGAAGVAYALTDRLQLGVDLAVFRDGDVIRTTRATTGLSVALQVNRSLQFDIGGLIGLNRSSPDCQVYIGVAHLF